MTPEQRRAKYPLPTVTPMNGDEIAVLRAHATEWLATPLFTDRMVDRTYLNYARLIATIDEERADYAALLRGFQNEVAPSRESKP